MLVLSLFITGQIVWLTTFQYVDVAGFCGMRSYWGRIHEQSVGTGCVGEAKGVILMR